MQMQQQSSRMLLLPMMALMAVMAVAGLGTLNGGTLASSAFDSFVTVAKEYLSNSYVLFALLISMVIGIWDILHGKGWGFIGRLLGIMVVAFILTGVVTSAATALPPADVIQSVQKANAAKLTKNQAALPSFEIDHGLRY